MSDPIKDLHTTNQALLNENRILHEQVKDLVQLQIDREKKSQSEGELRLAFAKGGGVQLVVTASALEREELRDITQHVRDILGDAFPTLETPDPLNLCRMFLIALADVDERFVAVGSNPMRALVHDLRERKPDAMRVLSMALENIASKAEEDAP